MKEELEVSKMHSANPEEAAEQASGSAMRAAELAREARETPSSSSKNPSANAANHAESTDVGPELQGKEA